MRSINMFCLFFVTFSILLSCSNSERNNYNSTDDVKSSEIIGEPKGNENPAEADIRSLLTILPDQSIFLIRGPNEGYLGSFYPSSRGIEKASFDSSGYQINIESVEIETLKMIVHFSLKSIGNEVETGDGKTRYYFFQVYASELKNVLDRKRENLLLEIQAEVKKSSE